MSDRVTEKQLQAIVNRINRETKSPASACAKDDSGHYKAQVGAYCLDNAYGGWSLARIVNEAGGQSDVLSCGKVPKRELASLMHAFLRGLETR